LSAQASGVVANSGADFLFGRLVGYICGSPLSTQSGPLKTATVDNIECYAFSVADIRTTVDQLEFALVPTGIVLGYGVTKILGYWAHMIRVWPRHERMPLLFFSSTALALFFMYMNFAGLWAYRNVEFVLNQGIFNVFYLFAITLPMLLLVLAVSVLSPTALPIENDLDNYFIENASAFYVIVAAAVGISFLPDLLPGVEFAVNPIMIVIMMGVFISLALMKNRIMQIALHSVLWVALVLLMIFEPFSAGHV
jgi:hypothetical protein